jgi:hypothetical protein
MKTKQLLTIALVFLAATAYGQTADDVINKYLSAIGGADKWKAIKSRKAEGKMTMQGFDLPVTIFRMPPAKQKVVVSVQGVEVIQAYDGKDSWVVNPLGLPSKDPVKVPEEESKRMKYKEFENDFIDYKKKGHEVKLLGTEDVDGIRCFKLQIIKNKNTADPITETHFLDADNYVPIMESSIVRLGIGEGKEAKTYMSDYQEVQGLMMPFTLETKIEGETIQKFVFEKITLNEPIDDSVFAFPKK